MPTSACFLQFFRHTPLVLIKRWVSAAVEKAPVPPGKGEPGRGRNQVSDKNLTDDLDGFYLGRLERWQKPGVWWKLASVEIVMQQLLSCQHDSFCSSQLKRSCCASFLCKSNSEILPFLHQLKICLHWLKKNVSKPNLSNINTNM